jgi:hypothetical protein
VGNLIPDGELIGRRTGRRGAEGTSGKVAPGRGAGCIHPFQYARCREPVRAEPGTDSGSYFIEPTVLTNTGPCYEAATIAFVISSVVTWGYRSGPRWLMALADGNAAERLGAFDCGIG